MVKKLAMPGNENNYLQILRHFSKKGAFSINFNAKNKYLKKSNRNFKPLIEKTNTLQIKKITKE